MLRNARRLTQRQLASAAGISTVTLNAVEHDGRRIRPLTLQVIAEALEVPAAALQDDVACVRELARIVGVDPVEIAGMSPAEGPLVREARRLEAELEPDRLTAAAVTLRGLVGLVGKSGK